MTKHELAEAHEVSSACEGGFPRGLGPCLVAVAFAALAWMSWGRWTDAQIDFGGEVYVPWRITQGDALYRDLAYRQGPLSHHVNALWFALFGVSVRTLVFANLALVVGIATLTFRIFRRSCGRLTATVVCLVQLGVFAFANYLPIANYNYVTPYQHSQTHGLLASLGLIALLADAVGRPARARLAGAGACLGLLFLTKAELFVPGAAAALAGLLLHFASSEAARARPVAFLAPFALGCALPVVACFLLLAARMDAGLAWSGLVGNWGHLGGEVAADGFYLGVAGFDAPVANLGAALRNLGFLAGFGALAGVLDRYGPTWMRARAALVLLGLGTFVALFLASSWIRFDELPRALPFVTCALVAFWSITAYRGRGDEDVVRLAAPLALWSVLALVLLFKMVLNTRVHHYGFALAMPASLLLAATYCHLAPMLLRNAYGGGDVARALGLGAVAATVAFFVHSSIGRYAERTLVVGEGADAIRMEAPRTSPRGLAMGVMLAKLEALLPSDATLVVLPEGVFLNYWLRRANPTRFTLFLPTELRAFGEDVMLEDLERAAPDFVVVLHRDHRGFGVGPFGEDSRNGQALMAWVGERYRVVATPELDFVRKLGFAPFDVLRRRD